MLTCGLELTDSLREDIVRVQVFSESLEVEFLPECFLSIIKVSCRDDDPSRWTELVVANPECHRGMEEEILYDFLIKMSLYLESLTCEIDRFCEVFFMIE